MCNFATDIKQLFTTMKQRYAVVVLFALIIASSMVGSVGGRYQKGVPPTSAGVNGNHPVAVRPTAFDDSLVDGVAMGNVLSV